MFNVAISVRWLLWLAGAAVLMCTTYADSAPLEGVDEDDTPSSACDTSTVNLMDFPQWAEEEGFWWGEYTFMDGNGDAFTTGNVTSCPDNAAYCDQTDMIDTGYPTWNYPYDHYWGFIRMKIVNNTLIQRNVFIYPPQNPSTCTTTKDATVGQPQNTQGVCGVNGNEKTFKADQSASDCLGNLAGPYGSGATLSDTFTTLVGNHSIMYSVRTPDYASMGMTSYAPYSDLFIQNQLTTLPGNGVRVRTAQGFAFGTQLPDSCSFYREYRLQDEDVWLAKMNEVRSQANIAVGDMCAFDSSSQKIASPNCYDHFQMGDGTLDGSVSCEDMNGGDTSRCGESTSDESTMSTLSPTIGVTSSVSAHLFIPSAALFYLGFVCTWHLV